VNACPGNVCSVEMPTTLAPDKYTWWVQTYNVLGYGPWRKSTFNVLKAPDAVTGLLPTGTTSNSPLNFSWVAATNSSQYHVYIVGNDGVKLDKWYNSATICSGLACSLTSPVVLGTGSYTWSVMPYNTLAGYGAWESADLEITP